MSKKTGWALLVLLAAAILFLNRDAYHGYFQDDEINAMSWTRAGSATGFLKGTISPLYKDCFRAVGFYYFRVTESFFHLDFPKYVAVIQAFHLLNVWMLWVLIRKLGAPVYAACFAAAFFGLHTALFDVVWKPAFVFDLLCATFCLASTLLWIRGWWIASFVLFWLAYQSKELAVMLPLVLFCYELWFGSRRWKQLALFFAASFSFAFQALVLYPIPSGDYSFHFTPVTLLHTATFYAGQVFLAPLFGFLLPVAAYYAGNRRAWFGLATLALYFVPLLFLPGRIQAAYCYLPFTGLAVALAGMAETRKPREVAIFLVVWLFIDVTLFDDVRKETLSQDRDIRVWVDTAGAFGKAHPDITDFAYNGMPEAYRPFGLGAVFKYFTGKNVTMVYLNSPEGEKLVDRGQMAILRWNSDLHQLQIEAR